MDNGKVLFSIDKNTKEVDFAALDSFAEPLKKSDSIVSFVNDFKKPIKTAIGKLKIDTDYMLNKALERDSGIRIDQIGYIKPTLERPAYIVEKDGKFHFIKPFIDEKDNVKKFLSVVSDRDGNINMVTSHILQNKNIRKIVKNGNIIEDFVSKNDTGRFTSGGKAPQGLESNQKPDTLIGKSIANNKENINENFPTGKNKDSKILYSKNFTGKNKTLPERMDALSDKAIDKLDNLFKGLTPEGKLKPQTNPLMDIFRTLLVPDAHKQKEFVELLRNNNKEKARQKIIARELQKDLNAIPKKENELLVMALDGDIAKEDIKTTLGDELYGHYEVGFIYIKVQNAPRFLNMA